MRAFDVQLPRSSFEVDVCTVCEWFWFDARELERLPLAPAERKSDWEHVALTGLIQLLLDLIL